MKNKTSIGTFLTIIVCMFFFEPGYTNTIVVDSLNDAGFGSLRIAVLEASSGDTIRFSSILNGDTIKLTSGHIQLDKNLVIIGNDTTNTIIDGSDNSYIFEITAGDTVTIVGAKIQNGSGSYGGINNKGVLAMINSAIVDNTATGWGGGINNFFATANFTNSTIARNTATRGGGISNWNSTTTFANCNISDNTASGDDFSEGGGIQNFLHSSASFIDCNISANSATGINSDGGGVRNRTNSTATFENCIISGNSAIRSGGGVANWDSSEVIFINSNILDNATVGNFNSGGGVRNDANSLATFTSSTISGNAALGNGTGGGVSNSGNNAKSTFIDCTVSSNSANSGGGLYNGSNMGDTLTLTNSVISGNSANGNSGGGIYNLGSASFINSVLSGNTASVFGGGIANDLGSATFINATLTGNKAVLSGGGVANVFSASSSVTFANTIVAKNTDDGSGPDIYNPFSILIDSGYNLIGDTTGVENQFTLTTLIGGPGNLLDPFFVQDVPPNDSLGGDLRLKGTSLAIEGGDDGQNVTTTDLNGDPRSVGCSIDIGAYEFQDLAYLQLLVTNVGDSGCGTLRQAVLDAIAGDTIRFSPAIDGDTIKLTSGQILLNKDLVILGNDTTNTLIDGTMNSRIFEITNGKVVSIDGVKLQHGMITGSGGAIYNYGTLSLSNSRLVNNTASQTGGAIYNNSSSPSNLLNCAIEHNTASSGGGIYSITISSEMVFENVSFKNNTAGSFGGALFNTAVDSLLLNNCQFENNEALAGQGGGAYHSNNSKMILNNSILKGNKGYNGGGIHSTGASILVFNHCEITDNQATFSGNQDQQGGGINNGSDCMISFNYSVLSSNTAQYGGALLNRGSAAFNNSTVTGNSAESGGAIRNNSGSITFVNSVISGNKATAGNGTGGAIWFNGGAGTLTNTSITGNNAVFGGALAVYTNATVTFNNSIIAKNNAANDPDMFGAGTFIDGGYNIIGDTSGVANQFPLTTLKGGTGNILDPFFVMDVPLNDSLGGDLRLLCNSPAIDAGNPDTSGLNLGLIDIDSMPRVADVIVDIGAYEMQDDGVDLIDPTALCKDTTIYLNAIGMAAIDSSYINEGSFDNCILASMSLDTSTFDCHHIGPNNVVLTVFDAVGNSNTCNSTVTVLLPDTIMVDNTLLSVLGESGNYNATVLINSDAQIKALNMITFKAGNEIILLPNFSVELNAVFEAIIGTCLGN